MNSLQTQQKGIKYLGVNLNKEVKDLYLENYKTQTKEIEDNTNRWKDTPCSWATIISTVIMTKLSKIISAFKSIAVIFFSPLFILSHLSSMWFLGAFDMIQLILVVSLISGTYVYTHTHTHSLNPSCTFPVASLESIIFQAPNRWGISSRPQSGY